MIYTKYKKSLTYIIAIIQVINIRLPDIIPGNNHIRTSFLGILLCVYKIQDFLEFIKNTDKSDKIFIILQSYLYILSIINNRTWDNILFSTGLYISYFMYVGFQFLNKRYETFKNLDIILYLFLLHPLYLLITKIISFDIFALVFNDHRLSANYGVYLIGEYSPLAVCFTYFSAFLISIYQFLKYRKIKYIYLVIIFISLSIATNEKIVFLFILITILGIKYKNLKIIIQTIIKKKIFLFLLLIILTYVINNIALNIENMRLFNNIGSYAINIDRLSLWSKVISNIFELNMYNPLLGYINYNNSIGIKFNDYHNFYLRLFMQGGFLGLLIFFYWILELRKYEKNSEYKYIFNIFFFCVLTACLVQDALKGINVLYLLALHKSILWWEEINEK